MKNSAKHFEKYKSVTSQDIAQPSFWFESANLFEIVLLIQNNVFKGNLCVLSYKCFKDSK